MNLRASLNATKLFLRNNKSTILMVGGIALTIFAVGEAIRATSNAKNIIDELEYEKFESLGMPEEESVDYHLDKKEVIKGVWKCYIWTFLLLSGAVTCCVCSHITSNRKIAAMSMAYASLLETYNTYQDNVKKYVKEKDQRMISHGVVHDIVESDKQKIPESTMKSLFDDPGDDDLILFRDLYSSVGSAGYFKRTSEQVLRAELDFNKKLSDDGIATLNDWYDCLDIGHSEIGDYFGWRYDPSKGPLFAITPRDDFNVNRDKRVVTGLGLGNSRYATYLEKPISIF